MGLWGRSYKNYEWEPWHQFVWKILFNFKSWCLKVFKSRRRDKLPTHVKKGRYAPFKGGLDFQPWDICWHKTACSIHLIVVPCTLQTTIPSVTHTDAHNLWSNFAWLYLGNDATSADQASAPVWQFFLSSTTTSKSPAPDTHGSCDGFFFLAPGKLTSHHPFLFISANLGDVDLPWHSKVGIGRNVSLL